MLHTIVTGEVLKHYPELEENALENIKDLVEKGADYLTLTENN